MVSVNPGAFARNAASSAALLAITACGMSSDAEDGGGGVTIEAGEGIADFVEPGFPFIVTTVDARDLEPGFAADNVTARGVVLFLGDEVYAAFDPDLLRMAVGWRGDSLELVTMAQISYQEPNNKANQIPRVLGRPVFVNGLYPGWQGASPVFRDPRPRGPNPDPGRGPLPPEQGRWNGIYVNGDDAVLSYTVHSTAILEQPSAIVRGDQVGIARTFRIEESTRPLTLVIAETGDVQTIEVTANVARIEQSGGSVLMAGVVDAPAGAELRFEDARHITLRLPPDVSDASFRVVVWRGPGARDTAFDAMLGAPVQMAHARGGPRYWNETVETRGTVSPDTAAYVVDRLTLPLDNPWRRNVRVVDVGFFPDGERAALVTFEGDVWVVAGIDSTLEHLEWRRYASGLYEPMGVEVVDDEIYVHSRQGIVRLNDIDGNGEADFYEAFSDLTIQSIESREFPLGFAAKPGGGFYLSRGGALDMGPRTAAPIMPGFRAGSPHSGSILEVSADGRTLEYYATGLREPFIGVHSTRGIVSASDQQGNFVPATPIYIAPRGGYHGVPATAHRDDVPAETPPVVWIPHEVDPSGAGHVWVTDERMGFGGDALIHLSYGRPGAFRVFVDSTASGERQGAVIPLLEDFTAPLLNGAVGPHDGQLYLTGFQIWGSRATELGVFARVRRTAEPSPLPVAVRAGLQGVLLGFDQPLDAAAATDVAHYDVQRWNYQRTEEYGSGHFMLDGSPGHERLAVASAHLSSDRRSVLLVIPGMREVMQMQVGYSLAGAGRDAIDGEAYLTLHAVDELDLVAAGFADVDWRADLEGALEVLAGEAPPSSAERGEDLYRRIGCVACHSTDGTTEGKLGPTFRGLYGSMRTFADGTTRAADVEYLRQAILEPSSQIVEGYDEGMPAYLGVLDDAELESLIEYIRSLR